MGFQAEGAEYAKAQSNGEAVGTAHLLTSVGQALPGEHTGAGSGRLSSEEDKEPLSAVGLRSDMASAL